MGTIDEEPGQVGDDAIYAQPMLRWDPNFGWVDIDTIVGVGSCDVIVGGPDDGPFHDACPERDPF